MAYQIPVRRILSQKDLDIFTKSEIRDELVGFIERLNESVIGLVTDSEVKLDKSIENMMDLLNEVDAIVSKHPAADATSSRFGKPEFRDFYDEIKSSTSKLLTPLGVPSEAIPELGEYLTESWGNRTRIDYGSGHELNFFCFLFCLDKLGVFSKDVYAALVLRVFWGYIKVMRNIQQGYWLEPAGSHGVWGLDDYHFLPFLFGSAQLATHKHLRPISIHDPDLVEMYAPKYMYFACIKFINDVKTASLRWHSPMLDDISGVKKWAKVNEGMIKMYKAEVLGKLPIMQHFLFGSIIKAPEGVSEEGGEPEHVHSTYGDCCGIKVPSAIAASQMENSKKEVFRNVRNVPGIIPFD